MQNKDSSHLSPALGILACLSSGNYIVGKFLLASMTTDERKDLHASNFEDAKTRVRRPSYRQSIFFFSLSAAKSWKLGRQQATQKPNRISFQVYLDFLLTTLSRRHFAFKNKYGSVERHLSTLSDAFCAAYSEADCFTMRVCADFLQDFQQTSNAVQDQLMDVIRQLFCIADFSEGRYHILHKRLSLSFTIVSY